MASKKTTSKVKQLKVRPSRTKVKPKGSVAPKKVGAKATVVVKKKSGVTVKTKKVSAKTVVAKGRVAGVVPQNKSVAAKKPVKSKGNSVAAKKAIVTVAKKKQAAAKLAFGQRQASEKEFIRQLPVSTLPPPLPPPPPMRIKTMMQHNNPKLTVKELKDIRVIMLRERARLTGTTQGLREQSLMRHDEVNREEEGTDAFIRLQDLDRACSSQATIAKIDVALRMLDDGSYGICERCERRIESPRLRALPFVKMCIKCQSETEGGHRGKISIRHLLWNN